MESVGSTTKTIRSTVKNNLTPQHPDLVRRLVGFYEYGKALDHFDALLARIDEEELEAIEDIVQELDELAVYTNVSRRLQTGASSLAEQDTNDSGAFQRRGLAWVMALARVELGAMLAGFTDQPNPFSAVRPSRYELPQYAELLMDGLRAHYWALERERDGTVKQVVRGKAPVQQMLAYGRRVVLTRSFLEAVAGLTGDQFSPNQAAEIKSWDDQLETVQYAVVGNITRLLASQSSVQQNTKAFSILRGCGALRRAVEKELAAGTARVQTISTGNRANGAAGAAPPSAPNTGRPGANRAARGQQGVSPRPVIPGGSRGRQPR